LKPTLVRALGVLIRLLSESKKCVILTFTLPGSKSDILVRSEKFEFELPISSAQVQLPKNSMISPIRVLLALVLHSLIATAAPVGICLHAYSPETPAEKIECFEFEKVERAGADYRFFPSSDKSVMVTAYRFRGTILYKHDLAPTHPEFDKLLKLYEETARATPQPVVISIPEFL
jgi:hypothetical protein